MHESEGVSESPSPQATRREFLQAARGWSAIAAAVVAGMTSSATPAEAGGWAVGGRGGSAGWVNGARGGGGWVNGARGGGWVNGHGGYGGGWVNGVHAGWVNGGGGWVNGSGWVNGGWVNGGGAGWVNGGGGGWINGGGGGAGWVNSHNGNYSSVRF